MARQGSWRRAEAGALDVMVEKDIAPCDNALLPLIDVDCTLLVDASPCLLYEPFRASAEQAQQEGRWRPFDPSTATQRHGFVDDFKSKGSCFLHKFLPTVPGLAKLGPAPTTCNPTSSNPGNAKIVLFMDCKRKDNWRRRVVDKTYKEPGAAGKSNNMDRDIWPHYLSVLRAAEKAGARIWKCEDGEADDGIAAAVQYELAEHPERHIIIVSGDSDFLQLCGDHARVHIINSHGEDVFAKTATRYTQRYTTMIEKVLVHTDAADLQRPSRMARFMLEMKLLQGDKSDDVPSVFGDLAASYMDHAPALAYSSNERKKLFAKHPFMAAAYERNQKLINFKRTPEEKRKKFLDVYRSGACHFDDQDDQRMGEA